MNFLIKKTSYFLYRILFYSILFYQKVISPLLPARCRYYPTCSNYGKQALAWHGVWTGSWLLLKRISRCHPLGGHGIDFVPLPLASYRYQYLSFDSSTGGKIQGSYIYKANTSYVSRLNYMMKSI